MTQVVIAIICAVIATPFVVLFAISCCFACVVLWIAVASLFGGRQ